MTGHPHNVSFDRSRGCELLEQRTMLAATLFTIDAAHSVLSMTGHVLTYDISPQANGSLFTSYHGSISAVVGGSTIQFDNHSTITANNNGSWQPGGTPGNYGGQTDLLVDTAFETVRNLVMNLTSAAITRGSDGSFANGAETFGVTSGEIDYADGINGSFVGDMAGTGSANGAGTKASYVVSPAGVATLTLPVNLLLNESVFDNNDTQLNLSGTLVATAKVTTGGTASITGTVFNDANANAAKDTSETGLSAWTVFIDSNKNGKLDSGEPTSPTTASGAFSFAKLAAGTYRVSEVLKSGYRLTTPATNAIDVTLSAGQKVTGKLFGNTTLGRMSGSVFKDTNANAKLDSGEAGFAGQTVFFDTNKNGKLDTGEAKATTGPAGNFVFPAVKPGSYVLTEVVPAGYRISTPTTKTFAVTVAAGQVITGKAFGDTQLVSIAGTVFHDTNGNGKQDSGEVGLANWRVFIDANHDGVWQTTEKSVLSNTSGAFTFTNLTAGAFIVRIVPQSGHTRTTPSSGSYAFSLTNGQSKTGLLFGEK